MKKKLQSRRQAIELGSAPLGGVSVRDAASKKRRPLPVFEATVLLVGALPELGLLYVQDAFENQFVVDAQTEGYLDVGDGVIFRALINTEGYVLRIVRKPN